MLRSLQFFLDLVSTENFTETADRNYMTQSAVSRHIKSLEEKLGHRLVARGRGKFKLTSAGELTRDAARDVLSRMDELELQLNQKTDKEVFGILRIHSSQSVGIYRLPETAGKFIKSYPNIDLQIEFAKNQSIYEALLSGAIDLGIVDHPKSHPQLHCEVFAHEPLVLIVPKKHSLAKEKRVYLKDLNGESFITAHQGMARREAFEKLIADNDIQVSFPYAFDHIELVKASVKNGMGIALIPQIAFESNKSDGVIAIKIADHALKRPLGVLWRKAEPLTAAAQSFLDELIESRKTLAP